ncbi:MAG: SUF system NifU family Fe-S cluster assembly protein [Paenibacillaceae bacterium]|jgi:nitrogen fixation NifU-like protein|nr:SUF system NifU family Fe-S cluster assembly protein [Paenibacillaceae bacterium]
MQLDQLYRTVIMDHYKRPHNVGELGDGAWNVHMHNPTCGDRIVLSLDVRDGVVERAKFRGEGCSISIASASMMTDAIRGCSIDDALGLAERFSALMQGEDVSFETAEDIEALRGVTQFPARIKCAMLPWSALKKAVTQPREEGGAS